MSLPKDRQQGTLLDGMFWVGRLFTGQDRYSVFREKILPAVRAARKSLERLYCADNGRPAIDPVILAGVTLLQFMEKVPDRKAAEQAKYHLGWKYGLGLPLDDEGFHATTLVVFRERLLEGESERVVFDAILNKLREEGLVKKRSKQRLDSTYVLGCISQMSTLEIVRETLRLALEELESTGGFEGFLEWSLFQERYCESRVDWKEQDKEKLRSKVRQAGEDGYRLLQWLEQQGSILLQGEQVQLLRRVLDEQFEWVEQELQVRKKRLSGTVCNPQDPDAQWAAKDPEKKKTWTGYKVQVVETVAEDPTPKEKGEPTEQFLTEITTTEAIASDIDGMERALKAQGEHGQEAPSELFVDAAYVSDDTLFEAQEKGTQLVGPARPSPQHHEGFPSERFHVNNACHTAICPAGKTNTQCSRIKDEHKGNTYYRYEWGNQCDTCPLQKQCTTSKAGRRTLVVGIYHDLLQARREEMKTEAFSKRMQQRNGIEGTISETTRGYGLRRSRYRGLPKTTLANYFIGAACNVNRWVHRVLWQMETAAAT